MNPIIIDTHILIWYIISPNKLSNLASVNLQTTISNGFPLYLSAISLVEICFLIEKGKIPAIVWQRILTELNNIDSAIEIIFLTQKIAISVQQIDRAVVPELPDRIIAATALSLNLPLITKDHKIRALSNIQTIWE